MSTKWLMLTFRKSEVPKVFMEKSFESDSLVDPTERTFARFSRVFQIEPVPKSWQKVTINTKVKG